MKGIIVYDEVGYNRNKWFVSKLIEEFKNRGVEVALIIYENIDSLPKYDMDFAIVRSIDPNINKTLETRGVRCYNNYKTSYIANNKYLTHEFCKQNDIPTMDTYLIDKKGISPLNLPFVAKSLDGHGGSEVFLVDNEEKRQYVENYFDNKPYIVQKITSTIGIDIRVYVMAGRILAMAERSSKTDFRSNFSLGGSARLVDISKEIAPYIDKVIKNLGSTYIGVDFIYNDGNLVLNEIEDIVGSRMLYTLSNIEVHSLLAETIIKDMNKQNKA